MRIEKDVRRTQILEQCFDCFCDNGISATNAKQMAAACKISAGNLYNYFESKDQIIIECTAHCMSQVENDFMERAPKGFDDIPRFVHEVPEWTRQEYGKKFRFMYQVYTSPKYREYAASFFREQALRYEKYSAMLESKLGMPRFVIEPLVYAFVRAVVNYALFENKEYLDKQLNLLLHIIPMLQKEYAGKEN